MRKDQKEDSQNTVEKYLKELEEVIQDARSSLAGTQTIEDWLTLMDELSPNRPEEDDLHRTVQTASQAGTLGTLDSSPVERVEQPEGRRPFTRSQGQAKEEDWVLGTALEHRSKGRPKRR